MSYVSTPFIFQLDVDFLPQYGLHESLMSYVVKLNITESDRVALIVPAFETERYRYLRQGRPSRNATRTGEIVRSTIRCTVL